MSDNKIKSALEKALERAAAIPQVSKEELNRLEYKPQGSHLAGKYLNSGADLVSELTNISPDIYPYVLEGIEETLLKNITLPADEDTKQLNQKALAGLFQIKQDKDRLTEIANELDYLFNYYLQMVEQAKASVSAKLNQKYQQAIQEMEARYGSSVQVDLENQPEFQKEFQQLIRDVTEKFAGALNSAKQKIKALC